MSLPLWLMAFDAGQAEVHLEPVSQAGAAVTPSNASAQLRMSADGKVYTAPTSGVFVEKFTWLTGSGDADDYEAFIEVTSGSLTGGTVGSWFSLGTGTTTGLVNSSDTPGQITAGGNLKIRRASDEVVLAESTFGLSATVAAS